MTPGDWDSYDQQQRDSLGAMGVEPVRRLLAEGKIGERKGRIARAWLAEQDAAAESVERETDRKIARQALARSTWANVIAALALITAVVAVAVELAR